MTRVIAAILFVWAGVLLGVSFIATPAKFLAPSLPMAHALSRRLAAPTRGSGTREAVTRPKAQRQSHQ